MRLFGLALVMFGITFAPVGCSDESIQPLSGDDTSDPADEVEEGAPQQPNAPPSPPLPDPPPVPQPDGTWLDPDGVKMLYPKDMEGSAWRLGAKDPNTDPEVVLRFAESVEKNGDFWTATSESGGRASGGSELTFRINVHVTASQGEQTSDHAKLAQQGYMVSPKDIRNLEMTGYFRVHDVGDKTESISAKVRGGRHTGSNDPRAACIGLLVQYTDADSELWEKELFHPKTPKTKVNRLVTHGDLEDKWVGVKAIVYNVAGDTKAISESWIDTDPFDASGKPKNQWKKVFAYTDEEPGMGGRPVTWGGKYETWRIDAARTIDFKLLSVHEIVPPKS